jgi:hypothetical protein
VNAYTTNVLTIAGLVCKVSLNLRIDPIYGAIYDILFTETVENTIIDTRKHKQNKQNKTPLQVIQIVVLTYFQLLTYVLY